MPYIWVNKFVIPISTGWYQEVIDFSWRGQKSVTTDCMDKKVSNFSLLLSFYRIYYSFPCNSCVPFLLLLLRVRWNCSQGDKIASLTDGMGQNLIIDILSTELLFIFLFFSCYLRTSLFEYSSIQLPSLTLWNLETHVMLFHLG